MRSTPSLRFLCASLLTLVACGGGGGGGDDDDQPDASAPPVAPIFRNPLPDLSDNQVANQALALLGAQVSAADRNCDVCHSMSRSKLHTWNTLSSDSLSTCLTDLEVTDQASAATMLACLRDGAGDFHPNKTGIYATAAALPWFEYLVHLAEPVNGDDVYADFVGRVQMPRGSHPPFTQSEFDIVAEWAARGMPLIDTLVPDETSGNCTPSITQAMIDHTNSLATTGWTAENEANGLAMFGCAGAATTRDCLATYPDADTTAYGATWPDDFAGAKLRVLRVNHYQSSYWTRSSADGRFVAHGGGTTANSTIIDLQRDVEIGTTSFYDPGFFPDNSGFAFQGSTPHFCDQRLLTDGAPTSITYTNNPSCVNADTVGLYQHLGAAIGGDYWTVNGQWENDNGGYDVQNDTVPSFGSGADITLTPMTSNGTTFVPKPAVNVSVPFEGDTVLSPSSTLLVSRVSGANSTQAGFRVHALVATPSGSSYTVQTPTIATYCDAGDKPALSFDERFMTYHHYVTGADAIDLGFTGPSDPNFAPYLSQHASNIYIVDLLTGDKTRITRTAPGQFALFPHFRSDGWLYFMVRAPNGNGDEYVVASDAALVIAGQ